MIISWNTTKACNLKCEHCYRDAGIKDPQELNTEEGKDLLAEIAQSGFKIVILSGGEPLMRQDIYELISTAKKLGMRPVLGSNGTLITAQIARKLKESGLSRAGISLDSTDAKIHDEFRQQEGAWKATVRAMQVCAKEGLDFQVHTTVTKRNWRQIIEITDFVESLGAQAHHIFFLVPSGRGKDISDVFINSVQIQKVLEEILTKQKTITMELKPVCAPQFVPLSREMGLDLRFQKGCLAGISYCCILPNGDVHPCPYLPLLAGNVRQTKFSRLWQESDIFNKLRSGNYSGSCGICVNKDSCAGCRARAYHHSADFMAEDPECFLNKTNVE